MRVAIILNEGSKNPAGEYEVYFKSELIKTQQRRVEFDCDDLRDVSINLLGNTAIERFEINGKGEELK